MKIMRLAVEVFTVIFLSIFVVSCAATVHGFLSSSSSYEEVFRACIQAANEVNFGVTSSDVRIGFITAEQNVVMGQGKVVRMNIMVKQVPTGTEVEVAIVPPPGTAGNIKAMFSSFTDALKRRVPDVKVVSVQ